MEPKWNEISIRIPSDNGEVERDRGEIAQKSNQTSTGGRNNRTERIGGSEGISTELSFSADSDSE